ncbi:MAG: hypothetical protein NTW73_01750 [Candidatus Parcubacteria bacterium]|nr:hypothetical protein [Candidatus Parcubacteria bacterium]
MNDTKTDQNTSNDQNDQFVDSQVNDLIDRTKKIEEEINATNQIVNQSIDDLDAKVDQTIGNVEKICSDLDKVEEEAGDELDKLAMEEAEDLSKE